jgi:hypothetical protein
MDNHAPRQQRKNELITSAATAGIAARPGRPSHLLVQRNFCTAHVDQHSYTAITNRLLIVLYRPSHPYHL